MAEKEFDPDWDRLEACQESLREHMAVLRAQTAAMEKLLKAASELLAIEVLMKDGLGVRVWVQRERGQIVFARMAKLRHAVEQCRDAEQVDHQIANLPPHPDTVRLNKLERLGTEGLTWIARESTLGRGYRLHQTSGWPNSHETVRGAIDAAPESLLPPTQPSFVDGSDAGGEYD